MHRTTLFVAGLLMLGSLASAATAAPSQVLVVRHAERAPEPKDDPAPEAGCQ